MTYTNDIIGSFETVYQVVAHTWSIFSVLQSLFEMVHKKSFHNLIAVCRCDAALRFCFSISY